MDDWLERFDHREEDFDALEDVLAGSCPACGRELAAREVCPACGDDGEYVAA